MPLGLLDVIWIDDDFIKPPGPKMMVCVEPREGIFFRINTEGKWDIPVGIFRADNPNVLLWDSHIQCGSPLELDDYLIGQSTKKKGIHGTLNRCCIPALCAAVAKSRTISAVTKSAILTALGCETAPLTATK